jgi:phage portal protein BeeE
MFWTRPPQAESASETARHLAIATEVKARRPASRPQLPLFQLHTPGTPVWTDTGYASLARHAYCRNPVAYRAVRLISEAACFGAARAALRQPANAPTTGCWIF